nr:sigma-70 family RNA polymerase sigma factor [Methylobacterium haplocladii]
MTRRNGPRERSERLPGSPILSDEIRTYLGSQLRELYETLSAAQQPPELLDLIARLDRLSPPEAPSYAAFRDDLLGALPGLRAFALSLAGGTAQADDLVQETLLKAWQNQTSYRPGTNLKAWLFTILRNHFYSERRKRRREVEDADGVQAGRLEALPDQEDGLELRQVWAKLRALPTAQREALLLVGAQGMTYEDAAELIGCQVGTVKSRVSRGRTVLAHSLGFADGRLSRMPA